MGGTGNISSSWLSLISHLMTDKLTKQLRFVMMAKAEYVMNKTRTHCSRLSQRHRQLMTAQPDPRDR